MKTILARTGFFFSLIAILNVSCISQRRASRNVPTTNAQMLQVPRGFSFNGLQPGQSLEEIHRLTQSQNLELIANSEIARIRNPKTDDLLLSMTISDGYVTGLYSDREAGLFVNHQLVFAENSPADMLKALNPGLVQLDGQHVIERAGCRIEVFCKNGRVEDFSLVGNNNSEG